MRSFLISLFLVEAPFYTVPTNGSTQGRKNKFSVREKIVVQLQRDDATLPTTSAPAAVWASGPSFHVSAMLFIYTYSLLSAYLPEH